jgi:hypothetical protein
MSSPPHQAIQPFYVLGLAPAATRAELEREAQKLLGMLELGLRSAATYATPLGPQQRTPELIRQAIAELRIPERRLLHELWAALPAPAPQPQPAADPSPGDPYRDHPAAPPPSHAPHDAPAPEAAPTFPGAFELFAWRRP